LAERLLELQELGLHPHFQPVHFEKIFWKELSSPTCSANTGWKWKDGHESAEGSGEMSIEN